MKYVVNHKFWPICLISGDFEKPPECNTETPNNFAINSDINVTMMQTLRKNYQRYEFCLVLRYFPNPK